MDLGIRGPAVAEPFECPTIEVQRRTAPAKHCWHRRDAVSHWRRAAEIRHQPRRRGQCGATRERELRVGALALQLARHSHCLRGQRGQRGLRGIESSREATRMGGVINEEHGISRTEQTRPFSRRCCAGGGWGLARRDRAVLGNTRSRRANAYSASLVDLLWGSSSQELLWC